MWLAGMKKGLDLQPLSVFYVRMNYAGMSRTILPIPEPSSM